MHSIESQSVIVKSIKSAGSVAGVTVRIRIVGSTGIILLVLRRSEIICRKLNSLSRFHEERFQRSVTAVGIKRNPNCRIFLCPTDKNRPLFGKGRFEKRDFSRLLDKRNFLL